MASASNTQRAADYLNQRFDGMAQAAVDGNTLVVTITGLDLDPKVRSGVLANPNISKNRDAVAAEIGHRIVPVGKYTLLTAKQQLTSESAGKVHRVENAILEDLLTKRFQKDLTALDITDDAEPGKAVATVRVNADLIRDMDTMAEHLQAKQAVAASGTGGPGRSA